MRTAAPGSADSVQPGDRCVLRADRLYPAGYLSANVWNMTEASEPAAAPTTVSANSRNDYGFGARGRLFQAAAWVVIVAGVVFVAAILFFRG